MRLIAVDAAGMKGEKRRCRVPSRYLLYLETRYSSTHLLLARKENETQLVSRSILECVIFLYFRHAVRPRPKGHGISNETLPNISFTLLSDQKLAE